MRIIKQILWVVACMLLGAIYVSTVPRVWQCEGVDEIEYLGLANSLLHGRGYMLDGQPHVLYPPLFPVFLSLVMKCFGATTWRCMYVANAFMGAMGLILMGSWIRRRFGEIGRWAAWFLFAAYYCWSFPTRFLMSEPLYLPLSFAAVILAWRILERNSGKWWEYGLFGLCALLITMTRSAAISLALALVLAGVLRWITSRKRSGLYVALLSLFLGCGFFAFWSIRADVVNPQAPESHWRWAKKYIGLSEEKQGIIATGEELTEYSAKPVNRVVFCAVRYGQFITSVVRIPSNFLPLACGLFALFWTGLIVHWKERPWSPIAWYTVVFLVMILMTTWLTNYHRFMFVLAPFLFLFLFEGLAWWARRGRVARLLLAAWGVWGLLWTFQNSSGMSADPDVQAYVKGWHIALALLYSAVFLWAVVGLFLKKTPGLVRPGQLALVVWVLLVLQAGALVVSRFRMALNNTTLQQRNLQDVVRCGAWLQQNTHADARCLSSLPRMTSFLADRFFTMPKYGKEKQIDISEADFILLLGSLREVPPYREREEAALVRAAQSGLTTTFRESYRRGDAVVFEVMRPVHPVSKVP